MTRVVFEKVCIFLDGQGFKYEVKSHDAVSTAAQAARARGLGVGGIHRGSKAMILSVDGKFVQCVVAGDYLVDLAKVKALLNAKEVLLANPKEVEASTGCAPGSVPPFGNLFNLPVYADVNLSPDMVFSTGLHEKSIFMKRVEWERAVRPIVADIGKKC